MLDEVEHNTENYQGRGYVVHGSQKFKPNLIIFILLSNSMSRLEAFSKQGCAQEIKARNETSTICLKNDFILTETKVYVDMTLFLHA